jgi:hypothetical protein
VLSPHPGGCGDELIELLRTRGLVLSILVTGLIGCASPTPPTADRAGATDSSAVESHEGAEPHFAAGGPDAEEYGARAGYPKGDRTTFWDIGAVVGSHSHLDEIFAAGSSAGRPRPLASCGLPSRASRASRGRSTALM